ncbi:hypothetical protein KBY93_14050 [Synechococcus sp. J7-Johnson]|uniref:hypothetical protein n=1 Tax=Synechococcus sp. J7-Johnson TaxID=2823737 RepID=UPI0020CD8A7C|nr:hypothetical protein [Synechococcus sp. J7-Johnson]MCP9841744.1 hypothetical protein [Synechococcus sp. J7-Johnson]
MTPASDGEPVGARHYVTRTTMPSAKPRVGWIVSPGLVSLLQILAAVNYRSVSGEAEAAVSSWVISNAAMLRTALSQAEMTERLGLKPDGVQGLIDSLDALQALRGDNKSVPIHQTVVEA